MRRWRGAYLRAQRADLRDAYTATATGTDTTASREVEGFESTRLLRTIAEDEEDVLSPRRRRFDGVEWRRWRRWRRRGRRGRAGDVPHEPTVCVSLGVRHYEARPKLEVANRLCVLLCRLQYPASAGGLRVVIARLAAGARIAVCEVAVAPLRAVARLWWCAWRRALRRWRRAAPRLRGGGSSAQQQQHAGASHDHRR